jgi:hypothetical protein
MTRRAKSKSSKTSAKRSIESIFVTMLIFVFLIALFLFSIWCGLCALPMTWKVKTIKILGGLTDLIYITNCSLNNVTFKFIFSICYCASIVLGFICLNLLIVIWFRSLEYIDIPNIKFFPKIKNPFYSEGNYLKIRSKYRELQTKNRNNAKELSRVKAELQKSQSDNSVLNQKNRELYQNSVGLLGSLEKVNASHLHLGNTTQELYNLMYYILLLKKISEPIEYIREFRLVIQEFSSTLIRVVAGNISDKHSSIMIVWFQDEKLRIIGSSGLKPGSHQKKFSKGQGFAGWIWETEQVDICNDVDNDPRFKHAGCEINSPFKSIIGVPIFDYNQKIIGVVFVHSNQRNIFVPEDGAVLSHFTMLLSFVFIDFLSICKQLVINGNDDLLESLI